MKRLLFLICIFCFIYFHIYAADEPTQHSVPVSSLPPLIFDTIFQLDTWSDRLNTTRFLLLDGTYLTYEEMQRRLIAVPGNEKHLRRAKGFEIGGITSAAIGLAALAMSSVVENITDFPDQNIQKTLKIAGFGGGVLFAIGSVTCFQESHKNLRLASRNYNFAVMGVPLLWQ
jgi:hypothetical protein